MNKDTKSFLMYYLFIFLSLNIAALLGYLTIENKDLIAFSGVLICLSTLILGFLVSINHSLRKIANSQTKDKNHE